MNWRRHIRFLAALCVGAFAAIALPLQPIDRTLAGGNLFFAVYLSLSFRFAHRLTSADLRRHGEQDDEGAYVIVLLALGAVILCLWAVFGTISSGASSWRFRPLMAIASVPLGWLTLHMVMAFHYAVLFYAPGKPGSGPKGGLDFPGNGDPVLWDFVYFSVTLGMTAQTSDVGITRTALRRVVTLHSALSFFFNTVILALAVNLAMQSG